MKHGDVSGANCQPRLIDIVLHLILLLVLLLLLLMHLDLQVVWMAWEDQVAGSLARVDSELKVAGE